MIYKNLLPLICISATQISGYSQNNQARNSGDFKPNVILFLIDDFGYGDISYEGNNRIKTPNIDRIAQGGARFTRFYQCAGASAPTRASLLTGRYHLRTGVWDVHNGRDFLHRDETTIADILKSAGYSTGAFGKWHSGKTWSYFSWNRGFDIGIHPVLYRYMQSRLIFNNKLVNTMGPVEDVLGNEVVEFIKQNRSNPFFAYVPIQSVHEPFNCPEELFRKYKEIGHSDHVARLYGMIELLDNNIGKILDEVEQSGLSEKTIIMFLSDDGPSPGFDISYSGRRMNENEIKERSGAWRRVLRGGKASIYEGGSITPFYIMWKNRIKPGGEYHQLTGIIDIFPTILEACGIPLPEKNLKLDGMSFLSILNGKEPSDWAERKYFDNTNFYRIPLEKIDRERPRVREISVHYRNYKLIRTDRFYYGKDTVEYELYDLEADPFEKENIADRNTDIFSGLKLSIDQWFNEILKEGRAYRQAVYEVGNWEERGTPVNPDGYSKLSGNVRKSNNSDFIFEGWTANGSSMTFDIDVVEAGEYEIGITFRSKPDSRDAEFFVFTEYDTVKLLAGKDDQAVSEKLHLPSGEQHLIIQLENPGLNGGEIESLKEIIINRIPGIKDTGVIKNPVIALKTGNQILGKFTLGNDVADFMFRGGMSDELLRVRKGDEVLIVPECDNPESIGTVEIFKDFKSVAKISNPPYAFRFTSETTERFTLNAEFTSKTGIKNSVRAYLSVE
ncbi:MAG: sulfatase-like hydrolase/transferase [Bacteroidales bacterium]|nr:sulfatase-like hydrolase/transferase [Bacteroidales bacterium]